MQSVEEWKGLNSSFHSTILSSGKAGHLCQYIIIQAEIVTDLYLIPYIVAFTEEYTVPQGLSRVCCLSVWPGQDLNPNLHLFSLLSCTPLARSCSLYQVTGDKNEEQVLNAIEAYTEHRPEITSRAINLLFDIARIERSNQLLRALKVSLWAIAQWWKKNVLNK